MKMKSILASIAACAIGASALAVTAFADVEYDVSKIASGDENYTCYIMGDSDDGSIKGLLKNRADVEKITAIKWTIECEKAADGAWYGGAFGIQSAASSWNTKQWCVNEENDEKVVATKVDDKTYEVSFDVDIKNTDDEYLKAVFQIYGDEKATTHLKKVTLVGLDALSDAEDTANTETTAKPDNAGTTTAASTTGKGTTTAKGNATTASASKTGDAGVGVAVAGLSLAAVAAYVARKKH